MTVLAEVAAPNAAQWAGFAAVASFLLVFVDKAPGLVRFFRGAPEKRTISFEAEFATKTEINELRTKVEQHENYGAERRKAIYKMIDENSARTDGKLDGLVDKISGVSNHVASVAAQCEATNTQMLHLSTQIHQMLQRGRKE